MRRVLVISPHPDDAELGCGGTIVNHISQGDAVHVMILTQGEQAHQSREACRLQESFHALGLLGVLPEQISSRHDFGDTYLGGKINLLGDSILRAIKHLQPAVLYCPGKDHHQDHQAARTAVDAVTRMTPWPPLILGYETISGQNGFSPKLYESLSRETMDAKLMALSLHASQDHKPYMQSQYIITRARFRAQQAGVAEGYAEAFEVMRWVRGSL